jgi:hypothetical protein
MPRSQIRSVSCRRVPSGSVLKYGLRWIDSNSSNCAFGSNPGDARVCHFPKNPVR